MTVAEFLAWAGAQPLGEPEEWRAAVAKLPR